MALRDTRAVRHQLEDSSLGSPVVSLDWGSPSEGQLKCTVSVSGDRVSDLTLQVGNQKKSINGELTPTDGARQLIFDEVDEGTKFKLRCMDPVKRLPIEGSGEIRYGKSNLIG